MKKPPHVAANVKKPSEQQQQPRKPYMHTVTLKCIHALKFQSICRLGCLPILEIIMHAYGMSKCGEHAKRTTRAHCACRNERSARHTIQFILHWTHFFPRQCPMPLNV